VIGQATGWGGNMRARRAGWEVAYPRFVVDEIARLLA
jgi:hypothetical protein